MTRQPFTITCYSAQRYRLGQVGRPEQVSVTWRHNALSTATLVLSDRDPRAADLAATGARVAIAYDQLPDEPMTGWVSERQGTDTGTRTFSVVDDFTLLLDVLGWPDPTSPLLAQTKAYDDYAGPAETVVRDVVRANAVDRLGMALTVGPGLGRGGEARCSFRMHPLADRLFPAVDLAGIGVTIRQRPDETASDGRRRSPGLKLSVYTPRAYPRELSDVSGAVTAWTHEAHTMTASRVVSGQQGEAEARDFGESVDTIREARQQRVIERFVDARDTAEEAVGFKRRSEALAEGAPTAGLSVTLAETPGFAYGRAVRVGDEATIRAGGEVVTDVLREATVAWNKADGLKVAPTVGQVDLSIKAVPRAVSALARSVRNLSAGR